MRHVAVGVCQRIDLDQRINQCLLIVTRSQRLIRCNSGIEELLLAVDTCDIDSRIEPVTICMCEVQILQHDSIAIRETRSAVECDAKCAIHFIVSGSHNVICGASGKDLTRPNIDKGVSSSKSYNVRGNSEGVANETCNSVGASRVNQDFFSNSPDFSVNGSYFSCCCSGRIICQGVCASVIDSTVSTVTNVVCDCFNDILDILNAIIIISCGNAKSRVCSLIDIQCFSSDKLLILQEKVTSINTIVSTSSNWVSIETSNLRSTDTF